MSFSDPRTRAFFFQALVIVFVVALLVMLFANTLDNLSRRGINTGFGFLDHQAGFDINFTLIDYSTTSSFARAFLVGLMNTLLVSAIGVVLATVLGFIIGIARLSPNWLVSRLAGAYVEIIRNLPLLLQLFFWYFAVLRALPLPRQSISVFGIAYLNNRGLYLPSFDSVPELVGLNFQGGIVLVPELVALLAALSIYTASFIAEVVRAGILSVSRGQTEASYALGLTRGQTLRLIVIPQALRVIVPPLTNQYLNLTKNSSLAVAIAYPDLVSVFAGTVLNLTGQAVVVIGITMAVYLFLSLSISLGMNLYNRRTELVGRS
jgi:general L-amino acid transport system permease protein